MICNSTRNVTWSKGMAQQRALPRGDKWTQARGPLCGSCQEKLAPQAARLLSSGFQTIDVRPSLGGRLPASIACPAPSEWAAASSAMTAAAWGAQPLPMRRPAQPVPQGCGPPVRARTPSERGPDGKVWPNASKACGTCCAPGRAQSDMTQARTCLCCVAKRFEGALPGHATTGPRRRRTSLCSQARRNQRTFGRLTLLHSRHQARLRFPQPRYDVIPNSSGRASRVTRKRENPWVKSSGGRCGRGPPASRDGSRGGNPSTHQTCLKTQPQPMSMFA